MRYLALMAGLAAAAIAWNSPALADNGHGQHGSAVSRGHHSEARNRQGAPGVRYDDHIIRPYSLSHPWHYGVDWRGRPYGGSRLSIGYHDGHWSGRLNLGYPSYTYCRPHYAYDPFYGAGDPFYGGPSVSYYVGGRPVYVFGDSAADIDLPGRPVPVYGADGTVYSDPYGNDDAAPADGGVPVPVTTYNDNRVTNNYYGAEPVAPAAPAAAEPLPTRAFGQRFTDEVRLKTPDGAYRFELRNGGLYAGLESGKPQRLSDHADAAFGAFAAWLPGDGISVFYREGDVIYAAYPDGGKWVRDPLPYIVNFGPDTSMGLVNGEPWTVFNTTDGQRYVVQFKARQWTEVGSARPKPAKQH
jgi:hypothetical protein